MILSIIASYFQTFFVLGRGNNEKKKSNREDSP